MLPIFKDKKLQEQFECEGFVKLNLFTVDQIDILRKHYDTVRPQHEAVIQFRSLYSSVETGNPELLIALDKLVKNTIMPQVEEVFQHYQVMISSYLVKESGDDTELMPHQDLSFVNEPDQCSFNLWIPLQKTNKNSGQLRVMKGSHLIKKTLRVVPEYPRPFVHFQDTIRALFTDIETEIGECVVINHAVLHGSSMNLTGEPRVAVILGMCSAPADISYYLMPDNDCSKIEEYRMKSEDYYYFNQDGRPTNAKLTSVFSHEFEHASVEEFKKWIRQNPNFSFLTKMKLLYFKSLSKTL
jgi:hypothetical protein